MRIMPPGLGRRRSQILFATFGALLLVFVLTTFRGRIRNSVSSTFRYWTSTESPQQILPHYYSEGIDVNHDVCSLHGWGVREGKEVELWDAMILEDEYELDLLEIRLHELDVVVDKYFIMESNVTMDGRPKRLVFSQKRHEEPFSNFKDKIVYKVIDGPASTVSSLRGSTGNQGQLTPWEVHLRTSLTALIRTRIPNTVRPPLVLFSSVPELPSPQTLFIVKTCAFSSPLHLQLREYMYSYEWPYGWDSWRAQVHLWNPKTQWVHELSSEYVLADSGWHCRYCYKHVEDYLRGIDGAVASLSAKTIQKGICSGTDMLNILPKAYSSNLEPSKSAVNLPRYMLENANKFRYLLPGGCMRDG